MSAPTFRTLGLALVLGLSAACALQGPSGHIGEECKDSGDCDDDTLGCVPVDNDNPGRGRACMPPPEEFACEGKLYGDEVCDCGCGVVDTDCANETVAACAENGNQCPDGQNPDPVDNSQCI